MGKNKRKHVLMTTMSILKSPMGMNYYYFNDVENASLLYCNGISSLEPGTKYFLSKYPIDEIIVIGSEETVREGDQRYVADLLNELRQSYQVWNQKGEKNTLSEAFSAFEFYKYRIVSFLQEKGKENNADEVIAEWSGKGISEKRRRELNELLKSVCQEENAFLMKPEPWREIERRIKDSIQKGFEDSPEYEQYKEKKKQLFSYQSKYCENERLAENYQNFRKEIEKDKELSLFEKEYCYVYLYKMVEESIHKNILKNMETELIELQKERDELRYQIRTIQDARQRSEFAYVKYLAYENLDEKHKLLPAESEDSPQKKISMRFVDEQKNGEDNVNGIVNALYGEDGKEKEMNLYIDMQGGNRTFSYVRNAILSILSNQFPEKVKIEKIVGTNYKPGAPGANEIVIENKRYQILDLVSGMNAFIRYGKADMIQNYCSTMGKLLKTEKNNAVDCLVEYMVKIDNSISLCDMAALADAIKGMRNLLNGKEIAEKEGESTSFVKNVFRILTDGIKNDYGKLLEDTEGKGNVDYVELISWCVRKGFVQQALTLIEDKMPEVYFEKKILEYQFEDDANGDLADRYVAAVSPRYEKRVENKLFYNMQKKREEDVNSDEPLFEILWHVRPSEQMGNLDEKGNARRDFKDSRREMEGIKGYVRRTLLSNGFEENDLKIEKKRIEDLIVKMSSAKSEEHFARLYCEFRKMNKEYEDFGEGEDRNLADPGTVYSIVKKKINKNDASSQPVFYSILTCCGTWEYAVGNTRIKITLDLHPKLEGHKEKLELLFLLHEALKQERNCCNHASEKGLRLPARLVKWAVSIYVKNLQEISGYLKEK